MRRKSVAIISMITLAATFSAGGMYVYAKIFGPQTVMQTDRDKTSCRQGNVLDGVWGQVITLRRQGHVMMLRVFSPEEVELIISTVTKCGKIKEH